MSRGSGRRRGASFASPTVACCLALCAGRALSAQPSLNVPQELPRVSIQGRSASGDVDQPARRCNGEIVSEIVIHPRPPLEGGMLERWQIVSRTVSDLHVTTQPDIVQRFLLLGVGDVCTEFRRAESERILRAQPFLAAAMVRPEPDGAGRVRLVVETIDEVTVVAGVRAATSSPTVRMLRFGEDNLLGQAIHASGEWRAGVFGRDGYGVRLQDYQLLGRPYHAGLEASRDELGGAWETSLAHPFLTDLQRVAWRASGGSAHDFTWLRQTDADELVVGTRRSYADVGGIVRVGQPGRLSLFGLSVSTEREEMDPQALRYTEFGPLAVEDSFAVLDRYPRTRVSRLNALWGVRGITFLPVHGFDALNAVQDMRVGLQAGALVGRSMSVLGSEDDDLFVSADLYAGGGTPNSFVMLEGRAEGRQNFDTDRWDGVLGSARVAWYQHLAERHTMITTAEWSGGWRTRVPFQLLLGQRDGGVRGYARSPVAGGQRAVVRVENRWHVGRYKQTGDYGLAGFVDAGKLWAGDVPFGATTSPRVGIGVGLLAAVPSGSQRLWRLDVGYPVSSDPRARLEVRLSNSNSRRFGWREPTDVQRSRARAIPQGIFAWP